MAVNPGPHNEAWKVVMCSDGSVLDTFNNGRDAIKAARAVNARAKRSGYMPAVQAVRA